MKACALAFSIILIPSVLAAEDVSKEQFQIAIEACGGGLSAEAKSTFQTAFDAASAQTPGTGNASINMLGLSILRAIEGMQSDDAKVAVLQAYYQCITPVVSSQFPDSNSTN